ncbi:DUF721 domain-containing protein [bacterium]|nr:MAG: DUF721 domain-containing protein [bacterium]QQR61615.1 MAG: DUF721 domain-containing protein [bacterium]QQR62824.1 MAG: DUF721 domain-containing protein [bacterium]
MFCKLISMVDMSVTSVQSIIADLSYFKASWKFQLLQCWPSIIGQLDEQVVLEKIGDDYIILGVENSCWMQELHALTHVIQNRINDTLDKPRIKKIVLKGKSTPKFKKQVWQRMMLHQIDFASVDPLSEREKRALNVIQDEELKTTLERFRARCLWKE